MARQATLIGGGILATLACLAMTPAPEATPRVATPTPTTVASRPPAPPATTAPAQLGGAPPANANVRFVPPTLGSTGGGSTGSVANAATPTPASLVPMPTGDIAYRTVQTIFNARCVGCHGGAGGLRLDGDARTRLVDAPSRQQPALKLVQPGSPETSYLWLKVALARPVVGAQMPKNGDPLAPAELETLRQWIAQGAK